ncbi:ribonuclease P 40kDa subunit-domain-containing protein [Mycena epipterygia]|nr:ribonuclease P 40kDa subunit-domain-containing protein [Mycena epipterygia]
MNVPAPPQQRVHISTGDVPSRKIQSLAAAHPFSQQLDVVFPADDALHAALSALETSYVKAPMELSRVGTFVHALENSSKVTMLSADAHADDVWCLDPRGLLTLHLSDMSYQTLGITGTKLPFKHQAGHIVALPLQARAESARKRDAAFKAWDLRRAQPWTVLYSANDVPATAQFAGENGHAELVHPVQCQASATPNVRVPAVSLPARPTAADDVEDWEHEMRGLFEWVGMAGLGAQRLHANDRVDPYVAVYDPPAPAEVGDVAHLRWRGFLGPAFVQSVVDAVLSAGGPQFVSITSHGFPTAPVGYIPLGKDGKPAGLKSPARAPREDAEDVWCVIVAREGDATRWCLAESIGSLDARWG